MLGFELNHVSKRVVIYVGFLVPLPQTYFFSLAFNMICIKLVHCRERWHSVLCNWTSKNMTNSPYFMAVLCKIIFFSLGHITISNCTTKFGWSSKTLQWRHNERDSVSNHQPHDCLLNRFFSRGSKNTSNIRVTGICAGNSPVTGEFPAQMASNAENVSIWWRHHDQAAVECSISHETWRYHEYIRISPNVTRLSHVLNDHQCEV